MAHGSILDVPPGRGSWRLAFRQRAKRLACVGGFSCFQTALGARLGGVSQRIHRLRWSLCIRHRQAKGRMPGSGLLASATPGRPRWQPDRVEHRPRARQSSFDQRADPHRGGDRPVRAKRRLRKRPPRVFQRWNGNPDRGITRWTVQRGHRARRRPMGHRDGFASLSASGISHGGSASAPRLDELVRRPGLRRTAWGRVRARCGSTAKSALNPT